MVNNVSQCLPYTETPLLNCTQNYSVEFDKSMTVSKNMTELDRTYKLKQWCSARHSFYTYLLFEDI